PPRRPAAPGRSTSRTASSRPGGAPPGAAGDDGVSKENLLYLPPSGRPRRPRGPFWGASIQATAAGVGPRPVSIRPERRSAGAPPASYHSPPAPRPLPASVVSTVSTASAEAAARG